VLFEDTEERHTMTRLNARQTTAIPLWSQYREASLNWLALGLLLAAWNAVDDGHAAKPRPESLRGYPTVSVRAATRSMSG
jgi:hypothetical protein